MTDEERIAKIRGGRWIRYARAEEITRQLEQLLVHVKTHRMPNLLIVWGNQQRQDSAHDAFSCSTSPAAR
jgi:hypothetical protein